MLLSTCPVLAFFDRINMSTTIGLYEIRQTCTPLARNRNTCFYLIFTPLEGMNKVGRVVLKKSQNFQLTPPSPFLNCHSPTLCEIKMFPPFLGLFKTWNIDTSVQIHHTMRFALIFLLSPKYCISYENIDHRPDFLNMLYILWRCYIYVVHFRYMLYISCISLYKFYVNFM